MPGRLDGRVAVVTGGSSGIGKATAQLLAAEGAAVVVADIAFGKGHETVAEIEDDGGRAIFRQVDVTQVAEVEAMIRTAEETFGGLHILFANAGVGGEEAPLEEWTDEMWSQVIDVNLTGVFHCCRAAIPAIRRSQGGSIVMTSSTAGITAMPLNCGYNAAKAGVIMLAYTLASEVGPEIRVNVVAPGLIRTPMTEFYNVPFDKYEGDIPMARVGQARDVAQAVLYLVSDEASYITRHVLTVDGGIQARQWPI